MPIQEATLDAYVSRPFFTLDAWVVSGRHRHHRDRDHFGADSDLYVAIDEPIGPWGAGTPVKYVIEDLYERISVLTSGTHVVRVMYMDAYVLSFSTDSAPVVPGVGLGVKTLDAIVLTAESSSFVLNSWVIHGGTFSVDAWVHGYGSFSVNAFVI